MPNPSVPIPKYRKHKASGQAVVTLAGRDHYLGPHGTAISKKEYDRLVREWLAAGRPKVKTQPLSEILISHVVLAFWKHVNAETRLKALFVETSFPSALQDLATRSGHLTPSTLTGELAKVKRNGVPVLLYHLKPAHLSELLRELTPLRRQGVRVLATGDEFDF